MSVEPAQFQYWCTKCQWFTMHLDKDNDCFATHKEDIVLVEAEQIQHCMKRLVAELRYTDRLHKIAKDG